MAETNTANPAADANKPDVTKQIADLTETVGKLADAVKGITDTQSKTGETLTQLQQQLADAAKKPAEEKSADDKGAGKTPTAEEIAAMVTKTVADTLNAREQQQRAAGDLAAKRSEFLKTKNPKLAGNAFFEDSLGNDPAKFEERYATIVESVNKAVPAADFGNAGKGGGATAAEKKPEPVLNPNLPSGVAKLAAEIQAGTTAAK